MTHHTPRASAAAPATPQTLRQPLTHSLLYASFDAEHDDWQDLLDRELPADPMITRVCVSRANPPHAHKLMLVGIGLGAGLVTLGYLAAAWAM